MANYDAKPTAGSVILGYSFSGDDFVIATSSNGWLRNGFAAIDGRAASRGYVFLRIGVVDKAHQYHAVAFGVASDEGETTIFKFLMFVDTHL